MQTAVFRFFTPRQETKQLVFRGALNPKFMPKCNLNHTRNLNHNQNKPALVKLAQAVCFCRDQGNCFEKNSKKNRQHGIKIAIFHLPVSSVKILITDQMPEIDLYPIKKHGGKSTPLKSGDNIKRLALEFRTLLLQSQSKMLEAFNKPKEFQGKNFPGLPPLMIIPMDLFGTRLPA